MRARERERPLLGIEPPFYKCTHNNVSRISHSPSVYVRKTWRSFLYEWEFVRRSSWGQRIVFRLPPYDTPRAARCNKAKFRVHRRHAAGGVCEQRITALRKYIPYGRKFWRGIYFGGLAVLRAIRQYFIRQKLHSVMSHYCEISLCTSCS